MNETNRVIKSYGMKINIKKTEVIKIGKPPSNVEIMVDGKIPLLVEELKYLGSVLTDDGRSEKDVREVWSLKKADIARLEAFEIWIIEVWSLKKWSLKYGH